MRERQVEPSRATVQSPREGIRKLFYHRKALEAVGVSPRAKERICYREVLPMAATCNTEIASIVEKGCADQRVFMQIEKGLMFRVIFSFVFQPLMVSVISFQTMSISSSSYKSIITHL